MSEQSTPSPAAAVVICCYTDDRWELLVGAVESVLAQDVPLELVVVVDHNDALLTRLAERFEAVRVIASTGERGLSGARNTGVAATGADVVLFLDDDARAEPGWARALIACFDDVNVVAAGGRVVPDWAGHAPGRAPTWFPEEFGWVVGCSYTGQPERRAPVRNPIGASMAVRRVVFDKAGGFSGVLGRVGALPVGCEETELCIRAAEVLPGAVVLLEPAGVVRHHVPAARQRAGYVLRRCYHEGRSKAAVGRLSRGVASLTSEQDYLRSTIPAGVGRSLRRGVRGSVPDLTAAGLLVAGVGLAAAGFVKESLVLAVRERRAAQAAR